MGPGNSPCTLVFGIGKESGGSVVMERAGSVTGMLHAAMSHAVLAVIDGIVNVSCLEIKTSYLAATLAGRLRAVGQIIKSTYKTAFLEARMYNEAGELTATASSVAKLVRAK